MKTQKKYTMRMLSIVFIVTCIICGIFFALHIGAAEDSDSFPTLYCNDEVWYKYDIFPLQKVYQSFYMPISILEKFDGISISSNEKFDTVLITYKDKNYISFNTKINSAVTNSSSEFYIMTYAKDGERYVPVETVCKSLGLNFEIYTSPSGKNALRISDGNQKKSFKDLTALYIHEETLKPEESTTKVPDTTTVVPFKPNAKIVYIIFDGNLPQNIDNILGILKAHNKKATFFTSNENLQNDSEHIIKIIAAGHSVGLSFDADGYEAECVNSFEQQNNILMDILKYKTRFALIKGKGKDYQTALTDAERAKYIIWNYDIDMKAVNDAEKQKNIDALKAAAEKSEILVLRFYANNYCGEMLSESLNFIDKNLNCNIKKISDASNP